MRRRVNRTGFTLIEILLVVAIIGILAAIVLAGVGLTRSKARDAKRLTDLRTIASSFEFYYNDSGHYPISPEWVTGCDVEPGTNWIPDGSDYSWNSKYLPSVPRDPSEDCAAADKHSYAYQSDGTTYKITTKLENPTPPAANGQTFSFSGSFFQPYTDTTPIAVSFQTSVSNPTNQSPIPLVVTFSREVVDFTEGSVSVVRGVISGFSAVLASLFNLFITPTDNDTVVVTIAGGTVHDQSGVGNAAAQFIITYDSLLPHPALSPDPLPAAVSGPFAVSANFNIPVVDFSAEKISVTNGAVTGFSQQNGSNYSFTVTPAVGGAVTVVIYGGVTNTAAGNGNVESNTISTTYTAP